MKDTADWLASLDLAEYLARFAENHIDLDVLRALNEQDLKDLGVVSVGHRRKMLRAIAALAAADVPPSPVVESPPPRGGERRQLTVMFCDLVGSTALTARLDPEEMGDVISAYQDTCAKIVAGYDGFVAKYMGDGISVYFGFPQAHEDDPERAVRAALDIVSAVGGLKTPAPEPLRVRIGIATGLVVVGPSIGEGASREEPVVGDTPNLAARLQALAEPGTIVIAAATRQRLGSNFKLRDMGRHELKGFAQPAAVFAVEGTAEPESRFAAAHAGHLTGVVGREEEIEQLLGRKRDAWQGKGQVVLVMGEAGIGKSSIAEWLAERIGEEPHTRLRYQCSPFHSNSALRPFIAQLERAAGFEPDDSPERRLDKLEALIATSTSRPDAAPLLAALLSIPFAGRYASLGLSPEQQRRETFAALLDQLEGLARRGPVLFIFEDAHWADATSLELFDMAVERIRELPILALVSFRPEFVPPWTGVPHVSTIALSRLEPRHVEAMVARMTDGRPLPAEVMQQIVTKTDGVPLFVEELTKAVLESGLLVEEPGAYRLNGPLPPLAIPATLQDSLMARLDRLAPVREIARIGAAIGREFSYALLASVVDAEEAALTAGLAQLEEAELIFRRGEPPAAIYTFKHALVQDAAYESLLKSKRQVLHRRLAETVRDQFAGLAATQPEIVAHHFTRAGLNEAAFEWWGKAGEQALRRSAYVEAIAHLGTGLGLVEGLEGGPEQRLLRLRLQIAYGQALIHARGWSAAETTAAFARARELAAGIEDAGERFAAYYGLWGGSYVRGELAPMREIAEAFLADTASKPGSAEAGVAHRCCGETYWFGGDYTGARMHLEQAVAAYDRERDAPLAHRFGQDIGMSARIYLAVVLWPLGEIERARHVAEEAVAIALDSGHIPTIAYAHFHACLFEAITRDARRAMPHAEALVGLCREHSMPVWGAAGTFYHGWARWHAGEREAGLAGMRQGIALFRQVGIGVFMPLNGLLLAEAEAEAEGVETGLAVLNDTIAEMERTDQRWIEAELHRQRGDLLLRRDRPDTAAAEAAFGQALAVARSQHARTFELRAALALARLHQAAGRAECGHELLEPALAGFAGRHEVPEVPEVAEAGRLLTPAA